MMSRTLVNQCIIIICLWNRAHNVVTVNSHGAVCTMDTSLESRSLESKYNQRVGIHLIIDTKSNVLNEQSYQSIMSFLTGEKL